MTLHSAQINAFALDKNDKAPDKLSFTQPFQVIAPNTVFSSIVVSLFGLNLTTQKEANGKKG